MIRKSKPPDKDSEFLENLALVSEQRQTPLTSEYIYSLGHSVYMIMDPEVSKMLTEDDQLKNLIAAYSHLHCTTNIDKKEARLRFIKYKIIKAKLKLTMREEQYENYGWERLDGLEIFAQTMISDAFHGWKGRLVTEQSKAIRTEMVKKKKGLFF